MAEPISTGTAKAATVAGVGFLTFLPVFDAAVLLGSFSGASVFVLSRHEFKLWKKLVFLVLAFINGVIAAPFSTAVLQNLMPLSGVVVSDGVGALLAASLSTKFLIFLIERDVADFFSLKVQKEK